jgi:transglutaminase-like putative cysteine protease
MAGCRAPTVLLAIALALAACAGRPAPPQPVFLHLVPVEVETRMPLQVPVRIGLYARDLERLEAAIRGAAIRERSERRLVVDVYEPYPVRDDSAAAARYRDATFLVDFDTPEVEALAEHLRDAAGSAPSVEEIVAFTRRSIRASTRGFDVASHVATHGLGDCTEHAVLFSALARRFGYAVRIALGVVLATSEGQPFAAGHAWSEVHHEGHWRLVDPTDIEGAEVVAYLPETWIDDEGPGFAMQLIGGLAIERVALLGNVQPR